MSNIEYQEIHFNSIENLIASDIILLVTATDLETRELHKQITPLNGFDKILQVYNESLTFYLGNFGKYKIAHIQCGMGSISRESSIITVSGILHIIKAGAVIMPGIAFGINDKKQKIGDVLVAEAIQPYNNKRVSSDSEVQRAYAMPSNKTLLNRLKNIKNWKFSVSDNSISEVSYCLVLSGEELIDNKQYRDELVSKYNTALGGEMEGAGVYAACDGRSPCILVKGICDFADGNKGEDKEARQTIAVQAAIGLISQLFNSDSAFSEFGVKPIGSDAKNKNLLPTSSFKEVLFDVYDNSKEDYYIERYIDKEFQNNILHLGAWVYGISGSGKSTLISRNLSTIGIDYIQINLALCFGQDVEAMFYEIYVELVTKLENSSTVEKFETLILTLKRISSVLKRTFPTRNM
ncbi:hypothetical protein [Pedobacter sp. SL55]|uniref:5'-methylthioadenosine/S-adenosylhomocysteine nucleosidase family protein n=1 Tax=Pedobacter sp. SL55 TaxID=2995161 RepID=UPI00226E4FFC|nr:hypothetical protein [Pedobacter sp. SL55]WAC40378.1 hypothetical protein OVA16_17675 [Pedobacter sp. SL55]